MGFDHPRCARGYPDSSADKHSSIAEHKVLVVDGVLLRQWCQDGWRDAMAEAAKAIR